MKFTTILAVAVVFLTSACKQTGNESDAYGNFEATEYMIAAENNGKIVSLDIEEGDVFSEAKQVGLIDTIQLFLQKEQLKAQRVSIASGVQNILSRIAVYQEQLSILKKDKIRFDKMFADGAATSKAVDDINGNILVVQQQIQTVKTENARVLGDLENVTRKMDALNDLIAKSKIYVPEAATVLEKYHEAYEMVNTGTPLFKLADLRSLDLRVYISGDQLSSVKIGQEVNVLIDKNEKENHTLKGKVIWISSQSEFTPKIIQTKKERVKLVYAVKIKVANDGLLKIGMPGEVRF
ncbi:hypothetical protein BZG02_17505 [Labilibaculum filiforme]|uniref:LcnD-like C-terminal domain-containing protein n=1 Tax=Labilibaculum filiforme TaxID=1940526 RepID=A0A2N3HSB7_9BACT|nr:HlyD family efflux transporter periplasmic adaptor subunit [Labilibaculum filiforme]PKQ60943.1 hypothetical protein BZG02_17505 [Labilibaculum filiforme]